MWTARNGLNISIAQFTPSNCCCAKESEPLAQPLIYPRNVLKKPCYIKAVYYRPPMKLREGNVFSHVCPMGRGSHDALHFTVHGYPPPRTWDLTVQPPPLMTSSGYWSTYGGKRSVRILLECFLVCHVLGILQGSHSDWKTCKNGKAFSSQGILNRLEKSGQEFQTNIICYFSVIFKWTVSKMDQVFSLKKKRH